MESGPEANTEVILVLRGADGRTRRGRQAGLRAYCPLGSSQEQLGSSRLSCRARLSTSTQDAAFRSCRRLQHELF